MSQPGTIWSIEGINAAKLAIGDTDVATATLVAPGNNFATFYNITFTGVPPGDYDLVLLIGTAAVILETFRDRLRDVCPGCAKPNQCFLSDQPVPEDEIFPSVSHFVTISFGAASFDQSLFNGGGVRTLNQDCQIVFTPIVQMNLDRLPSSEKRLLHISRGLATWEQNILSSNDSCHSRCTCMPT